jgi:recombination protein RecT
MSDPTPTTAVTRPQPVTALSKFLMDSRRLRNLADYARGVVKPETLVRLAVYEANKVDAKGKRWMENVSPESVYASLIISAQLGLEPSSIRGEAYLIPFKGSCSLMPGYRGLIKLALRSGAVKAIRSRVVYEGDDFAVKYGTEESIHHVPAHGRELLEGASMPVIIGAYAVARMANDEQEFDFLDGWELDKHRAASAQANGPAWQTWAEEMYRKAPVRRLAKYLPLGEDFARASKVDELHEAGKADQIGDVIDLPPDAVTETVEPPSRIAAAAERAKGG